MRGELLAEAVESVTDPWRKQRKREERGRPEVKARRRRVMRAEYQCSTRVTIKEAAYACMEAAYLKASADVRRHLNTITLTPVPSRWPLSTTLFKRLWTMPIRRPKNIRCPRDWPRASRHS